MRLELIHPRWLYVSVRRYNHQINVLHTHALTDVIRLIVPGFGPTSHVRRPTNVGMLSFNLCLGHEHHVALFVRRNRSRNGVDALFWVRKGTLRS